MKISTTFDKLREIFNRSGLSFTHFGRIVGRDRRTVVSWTTGGVSREPSTEVKRSICRFFRFPFKIWDEHCLDDEFLSIITGIDDSEIRIIDEGYLGGLLYTLEREKEGRLVLQSQFPGPVYRDKVVSRVYHRADSAEIKAQKDKRSSLMLDYAFQTSEWYTIKSLLNFAYSPIGVFYSLEEKIRVLDLMHKTFYDNYNKRIFFYDSFSVKVYGMDVVYTGIDVKNETLFFKSPLESLFVEIQNKPLVEKFYRHFSSPSKAPEHIQGEAAVELLRMLKTSLQSSMGIHEFCKKADELAGYNDLFQKQLSSQFG